MIIYFALHLTPVQNWIVKRVTNRLSEDLHTTVKIDHIDLTFFNNMVLKGLLVEDKNKDTLLAAGYAKVNITDWFFLKDNATLEYIGLEDAMINLKRTDSVWNYQFLIDYFGGSSKSSSSSSGLQLDIKTLELKNLQLNQIDSWVGQDMKVSFKELDLDANNIDINNKKISLNTITIDECIFAQYSYLGNRKKLGIAKTPRVIIVDPNAKFKWNNDGWVIDAKLIQLKNSAYKNDSETDRLPFDDKFDGEHFEFAQIAGELENVHFEKDTLTANIQLATKERSGFEIKKLEAAAKFTPAIMEFNDLDIVTNNSRLRNYYSMSYEDFNYDMGRFLHNVILDGHFTDSRVDSDDLAYFAPELSTWKRIFYIKGKVKGTIDNLSAKEMTVKSGNTYITGAIALRGLPDINNTFIDLQTDRLQTNYNDIITFVPPVKKIQQPRISALGNIIYSGNFTGFLTDFVTYGTFTTDIGTVTGDINMKFNDNAPPVYIGKVSTTNFKLGRFLNTEEIGSISFSGDVNGKGITANSVSANFKGDVSQFEFSNYNYKNIQVKGDFKNKLFQGNISITDPNLEIENLEGTIDLSKDLALYKFNAILNKANFKELHISKDDFVLSGKFNLDFTGGDIDEFLGAARISNATLLHNNKPLSFDSLVLTSYINDEQRHLALHSNELDAVIKGNYKIMELPDAFSVFLSQYYPAYIKPPIYRVSDQDFSFDIKTKNISDYTNLIDTSLRGFNDSWVYGHLKLKENELNINANVPGFSYAGKTFNDIQLNSRGNLDTLVTSIKIDDITLNDSLHLPSTVISITSHDDLSDVSIDTRASKTLSDASLNAQVRTMKDGISINFAPSSFIINDKKWQLENDGELTLRQSQVSAENVILTQGNQKITISTQPSDLYNSDDIYIGLNEVSIDDLAPFVIRDPRLEGIITGNVVIANPFGKSVIDYEAKANEFRLDGDSIGTITAKGNYTAGSGLIKFQADADNADYSFNANGSINIKDSTGNKTDIAFTSKKFNLALLNNYMGNIFSDIKGMATTSDLRIIGNAKKFILTGTAILEYGSLVVDYTKCKYSFKNEDIIFNPGEINLGSITLKDTLNNTATLSGRLYHNFFKEFVFDNINLRVNTPLDYFPGTNKLLVLNTTKKDNIQFYGKVIGDAKTRLSLNGPVTNMVMNISGEPSPTDSSHIYLPSEYNIEGSSIDYIDFVQFGTKIESDFKTSSSSNIVLNMDLTANPACKIDVILDEATKDIIRAEGTGNLKLRVGNKEPLSIRGTYYIAEGEYTFNFQTFLKKKFALKEGYISWSGDPYLANINIFAEYVADNVDFASISNNSIKRKEDLSVLAHLTNTLKQPKISFEFKLPPNSDLNNNFVITNRLQEFQNDPNEMNKQVTSLLLFNSFINNQKGFLNAGSGYSVVSGTIGGIVANALSSSFSKLIQRILNDKTISTYIDVNSTLSVQSQVATLQGAAKVGITKSFQNGRMIISVGGNFDYNNPYITTKDNNLLLTPDITVEYLVSKDGRVRIVGFNQTSYDVIGQRNRTGLKFSYRKEFDKFRRPDPVGKENK